MTSSSGKETAARSASVVRNHQISLHSGGAHVLKGKSDLSGTTYNV